MEIPIKESHVDIHLTKPTACDHLPTTYRITRSQPSFFLFLGGLLFFWDLCNKWFNHRRINTCFIVLNQMGCVPKQAGDALGLKRNPQMHSVASQGGKHKINESL